MIMEKLDLRQQYKAVYAPSAKEVSLVTPPNLPFLMLDGQGNPNVSEQFQAAVQAMYNVSYTLKFMVKKELGVDYPVMPLEGLWWTEGGDLLLQDKSAWLWTLMIAHPEVATAEMAARAMAEVVHKKGIAAAEALRYEWFEEGLAAQILHVGPYSAESPTIAKLHAFLQTHGYRPQGRHHEIYLGDPRRAAPDKLKTILRQPCALV